MCRRATLKMIFLCGGLWPFAFRKMQRHRRRYCITKAHFSVIHRQRDVNSSMEIGKIERGNWGVDDTVRRISIDATLLTAALKLIRDLVKCFPSNRVKSVSFHQRQRHAPNQTITTTSREPRCYRTNDNKLEQRKPTLRLIQLHSRQPKKSQTAVGTHSLLGRFEFIGFAFGPTFHSFYSCLSLALFPFLSVWLFLHLKSISEELFHQPTQIHIHKCRRNRIFYRFSCFSFSVLLSNVNGASTTKCLLLLRHWWRHDRSNYFGQLWYDLR